MSGEAGAHFEGELFGIFVGSGISVSIHVPHGDDGTTTDDYFAAASAPYDRWLARAAADLADLFTDVRARGELPLVALRQQLEMIDGTIVDDPDDRAEHFARYHRGGPLATSTRDNTLLPHGGSLALALAVTGRVRRSDLDTLLSRVAAVLLRHIDDPPPPVHLAPPASPPPSAASPSLAARMRRWFARR